VKAAAESSCKPSVPDHRTGFCKIKRNNCFDQATGDSEKRKDAPVEKVKTVTGFLIVAALLANSAFAGVPLTNLEGVGGVAFNPLAYPANAGSSIGDPNGDLGKILGRPQVGGWYVNLGDVKVDWTSFGLAETFAKRLEVSFGHETIMQDHADEIEKNSLGAKLLLIKENAGGNPWVPAVSAGIIGKNTSPVASSVDSSGYDVYLVATKFITDLLPRPLLISGGILNTNSRTTGVFGYDDDRATTFFANADLMVLKDVAVGVEYKQGAKFDDFKNANYWDAHVAWFVNKNLTLVAAYVNAGKENSSSSVGLGDGYVLSLQYAF
jgi:hypothetical protein